MVYIRKVFPRLQAEQFFAAPDPRFKENDLYRDSSSDNKNKAYGDFWWDESNSRWLIYLPSGTTCLSPGDWIVKDERGTLHRVEYETFKREYQILQE